MLGKIKYAWGKFASGIEADRDALLRHRSQINNEAEEKRLTLLLTETGIQSMAAVRCMQLVRDVGVPKGGEVFSRLIRYVYGMEIHWKAEIDSGTVIENGLGLVISKAAKIGPGCVLCQHVTLGVRRDPVTKESGAPTLERNVYVGPGATLLGPITIGAHAKIAAGCVVIASVPPYAIVDPPESVQHSRK